MNKATTRCGRLYGGLNPVIAAILWMMPVFFAQEAKSAIAGDSTSADTPAAADLLFRSFGPSYSHSARFQNEDSSSKPEQNTVKNRGRILAVGSIHTGLYAGSMIILNKAWYSGYPRSGFHTFNDWGEWQHIDKLGHGWSAYQLSRASMASWNWAGVKPETQKWLGGLMGFTFQTVIEIQDAFSAEWGWSWGDIAANTLGSGLLIGQSLAWGEQRLGFKWSFHRMDYDEALLNQRSNQLYGSSFQERMLKDYNGQTYWLSANPKSFFKQSRLPAWLNIAVGYGGTGMFGGTSNYWTDKTTGISYNRSDIARQRQFYLAPDIDFTRIKTHNRWLKSLFFCLNAFKMPAPTLVFSKGKMRVHGFYF